MTEWNTIGDKLKNSILQLHITRAVYDPLKPYSDPTTKDKSGTAFIVDITKGYVVTSAHLVANALVVVARSPRLGRKDISLDLVGICREKDVALCKINPEDISLLTTGVEDLSIFNMVFGDSIKIKETDEVMTIGYPLGQENIKYTIGIVSGFETRKPSGLAEVEDARGRSPSYIQITAAINPGNSGGPLLNCKGEVIGINAAGYLYAQNVGYAIPSRTFLSVYSELIRGAGTTSTNNVIKMPTLGLEWNKTNREIMGVKTGDERMYGIYVRRILPDSCVDTLEPGDIIKRLDYEDCFWNPEKDAFCLNYFHTPVSVEGTEKKCSPFIVNCYFDRYGDASLGNKNDKGSIKLTSRRLNLAEIMDMVPIGANLNLEIYRGAGYIVQAKYQYKPSYRIDRKYQHMEPIAYELFAGLCCANLDLAHIDELDELKHILESDSYNKYRRHVVICQVFPDTIAYKTQVLKQGHIIERINETAIETVDDIRKILSTKPEQIRIETTDKSYYVAKTENFVPEDKKIMKLFNIKNHQYAL